MESIFSFVTLLITNIVYSNEVVRIIFTCIFLTMVLLFIIAIIKVIQQNRSQKNASNYTKEQAVDRLVEYIKPYYLVCFITRILANLHSQQVIGASDADGELFFCERILQFIEHHINQFNGTTIPRSYDYEYIQNLLERIYPESSFSSIYVLDRLGGGTHQRFHNQRLYNRHRVSNEYIEFTQKCLNHNNRLIDSQFGFSSTTYLKVLAELFFFEVRRQQKETDNADAWCISREEFLTRFNDPIEADRVISFINSESTYCKLYDIKGFLFASDFTVFEDNAYSLIVNRLEDGKSSFGRNAGTQFENTVANILKKFYKVHQRVFIKDDETDIVCEFGDVLILVETKSRIYTFEQMEDRSHRSNANTKLKIAFEQLQQRYQALIDGNPVRAKDSSILVSAKQTKMCIPLIVTLEDHYENSNLDSPISIEGQGVFVPIILSLDELGGIIGNCTNPFEFTSFLLLRQMNQIKLKYPEMDKFVEFIQQNKLIGEYHKHDPYRQNKIRDHYAVSRVAKRLGVSIGTTYQDALCPQVNSILNAVALSSFSSYNSIITLLYRKLVWLGSLEKILSTKFELLIPNEANAAIVWSIRMSEELLPMEVPYLWIRIKDDNFVEIIENLNV